MMVENHDRLHHGEQIRLINDRRSVTVHHDQHRVIIHETLRRLSVNKHIIRIIRIVQKTFLQGKNRGSHFVLHDIGTLIHRGNHAVHPYGRTETIHVSIPVPHNQHFILRLEKFLKSLRLHSRFHSRHTFRTLTLSAEEAQLLRVLHDNLIAASTQCHIHRGSGILVILCIIACAVAYSKAQGHGDFISHIHFLYLFQDREAVIHHFLQGGLFQKEEILILFNLLNHASGRGDIAVNFSVYQSSKERSPHFFNLLHHIFVVVDIRESEDDTLFIQLLLQFHFFRFIPKIDCHEILFFGKPVNGLLSLFPETVQTN